MKYKQEYGCLLHFVRLATTLVNMKTVHETTTLDLLLNCNFANYSPIYKKFIDTLSNKPFLVWLLTTQSDLKYVAIVPCNLSLTVCFLTLVFHKVVWHQYARNGGIFNNQSTANLPQNVPVKKM